MPDSTRLQMCFSQRREARWQHLLKPACTPVSVWNECITGPGSKGNSNLKNFNFLPQAYIHLPKAIKSGSQFCQDLGEEFLTDRNKFSCHSHRTQIISTKLIPDMGYYIFSRMWDIIYKEREMSMRYNLQGEKCPSETVTTVAVLMFRKHLCVWVPMLKQNIKPVSRPLLLPWHHK